MDMVCVKVLLAELKAKEPAEEDILRCKMRLWQTRMRMAMWIMAMKMRMEVMKMVMKVMMAMKMNSSGKSRRLGFPRVIRLGSG